MVMAVIPNTNYIQIDKHPNKNTEIGWVNYKEDLTVWCLEEIPLAVETHTKSGVKILAHCFQKRSGGAFITAKHSVSAKL